ncbi:uncharacterized protein LOC134847768 [Symsagittifera roscoffensis]|uniref:uncharacterized protein LOC134847768 n=1 Tax=Symsagittifera roscoffensis TaxID=84072 RepID=UPI00307B8126
MVLLILINYRNFIQLIFFHLISDLIKGVDSYNNFFSSPFGSFSEKSNSFFDYEGLQEGGGDNGGGGYASTNEYYYEDSYRHYNIRCAHCWTNDPNDSCAQGSIDSSDIVTVDKCADDDINLCYTFINTKSSPRGDKFFELTRGCAKSSGNPCNAGPKYDTCSYEVCPRDLCNSSLSNLKVTRFQSWCICLYMFASCYVLKILTK